MSAPQAKKTLGADFRTRALTALIGGPLILLITVIGGPLMNVVVVIVGLLAGLELLAMLHPATRAGQLIVVVVILAAIEGLVLEIPHIIGIAIIIFGVSGLLRSFARDSSPGAFFIRNYLTLIAGLLYIGIPLGLVLVIRERLPDGLLWTLVLFVTNWGTDAFALMGGRIAGRTKLAPTISPGKTIEGAAIGLMLGTLAGVLLAVVGGIPFGTALLACIVVAISTQIGDLFESWTKRRLAVKDSGSLLPGHGGILDRIDGTLLAAPMLYLVLTLLV